MSHRKKISVVKVYRLETTEKIIWTSKKSDLFSFGKELLDIREVEFELTIKGFLSVLNTYCNREI